MPNILLRSAWQVVNIGDIAHTPGALALLEKEFPEAKVTLWASPDITPQVIQMEQKRFPGLKVVTGSLKDETNLPLKKAAEESDFMLHGSAMSFAAYDDIADYVRLTGKPFGAFGIGYNGEKNQIGLLNQAQFIYYRDTKSLILAKKDGIHAKKMAFGPDCAFAVDLKNEETAAKTMEKYRLEPGNFVCCIPRLRYTPYWNIRPGFQYLPDRDRYNNQMKEHDHRPLRDAICAIVRQTGKRVFLCPEDTSQIAVGREMLLEPLPEDVKERVSWKEEFWLTDEAVSVYRQSAGLFGNEMHSPIMCIANGIPAIVCRWKEQTTKGFMWEDLGIGEWLFDMDQESQTARLTETVLEMVENQQNSRSKARAAGDKARALHRQMANTLKAHF
jgi:hypothetical protein